MNGGGWGHGQAPADGLLVCSPGSSPRTFLCAFAWFSDLLVEHAEIFWSLFAVDMDAVLAEQPPDTWDSFPLLQVLNDYLRIDENLCGGRFHQHLRDTFAPQVVRYVDLMESSIAQSLHKGFEKEHWEIKGAGARRNPQRADGEAEAWSTRRHYTRPLVVRPLRRPAAGYAALLPYTTHGDEVLNPVQQATPGRARLFDVSACSNGCPSSEELFWKLDALQCFIRDLHWPDEVFAKHLEQRLKLMACDMVESCVTSNGCPSSEELFWKLDALQCFIRDLHWPDEVFAKHLEQRLKLMACDMVESCVTR
ncbi:hypothetical protein HPB50_013408 [Hyalomma asiaticum]|uniref:Uncharacterized protein n=1 Tax=Hyalomma asiaticum TaxID=266040 RepID=A0ACB7RLZ0_HYAAI|nr:hypothetical protein HPB50_013408 [Hyalomma asiaticum]